MQMAGAEQGALHFPEQAEVPETTTHLELRTLLYLFLKLAFADVAQVGSEQFVYWDPTDLGACLAPDAFVRFGKPDEHFESWKVWERGAPQVAIEIISKSDENTWDLKLDRYRRLGVSELVAFNPNLPEQPLRVWDFVGNDFLERHLFEPWAHSPHLNGYWLAVEVPGEGLTLRLSHDPQGEHLVPTPEEAEARRAEAEARRAEAEARRADTEAQRADRAESELRDLRAMLLRNP
jgi:hypothetical protein